MDLQYIYFKVKAPHTDTDNKTVYIENELFFILMAYWKSGLELHYMYIAPRAFGGNWLCEDGNLIFDGRFLFFCFQFLSGYIAVQIDR